MEILLGLFFLWVFTILVGHGSWVVLKAIFSAITGQPKTTLPQQRGGQEDIAAGYRVIHRMLQAGLIDQEQAADLCNQLRNLQFGQTTATIHPLESTVKSSTVEKPAVDRETTAAAPQAPAPQPIATTEETPILAKLAEPAAESDEPVMMPSQPAMAAPPVPAAQDQPPVLSRSEVIQSFLAAHNIRWGELVAGMLIVVCSIGLVISLWKTLIDTHRVIPSLIFLGANTAIYAAGLYTLARWRLRHTSRAVLIIATLLVPLSVLAGLAAAGTGVDAVQLNDPVTLAAIGLAGIVYSVLLLLGGRALTGPYARQIAISVAGPAAIIPFMPAAVRTLGAGAGWFVSIGSAAIVVAMTWMIKSRRRDGKLGVVGSRSRLLAMSVAGFSMAVAIGYAVFAVHGDGLEGVLRVAIASIPALIALSATGRSLMTSAQSATQSLAGAVSCVMLFAVCWAILPAAMVDVSWLWTWAAVLSIAGLAVGWILRQPRWLPASTLPVGLAAIGSSHVWMSGVAWESIPLWNRLIGGQAMLAAALVATVVSAAAGLIRDPDRRRWMGYAALFWIGVSIISAGVCAVSAKQLLAIAPWWSVTIVLSCGAVAAVVSASRFAQVSIAAVVAVGLAWCSVFRPQQLFGPEPLQSLDVWMFTALATSASLMLLRELAPRIKPLSTRAMMDAAFHWQTGAVASAAFAAVIGCVWTANDWATSAIVLALSATVFLWAATAVRSIGLVQAAQLTSVAAAVAVGYGRFNDTLFPDAVSKIGPAVWGWAIVMGLITACWFAIRELSQIDQRLLRRRFRFIGRRAATGKMIDGWIANMAIGLAAAGSAWLFVTRLLQAAETEWITVESGFAIPLAAIAIAAMVATWIQRDGMGVSTEVKSLLPTTTALSMIVWLPCYLTGLFEIDPTTRLIIATTLAVAGAIGLRQLASNRDRWAVIAQTGEYPTFVSTVMIFAASATLLTYGWLMPISNRLLAQAVPTVSVAAWWLGGAAACWIVAKRNRQPTSAIASAILTPAAAAILVPVFSVSHPFVWIQYGAIASAAWVAVSTGLFRRREQDEFSPAVRGSLLLVTATGLLSATLVMVRILFNVSALDVVFGPASVIVSAAAVLALCWGRLTLTPAGNRLAWPVGITLLAGQATWLIYVGGWISSSAAPDLLLTIWCAAAAASLVRYRLQPGEVDFWHTGLISTTLMLFTIAICNLGTNTWMPWVGTAAAVCAGLTIAVAANRSSTPTRQLIASRVLGWATIVLGILVIDQFGSGHPWAVKWTVLVTWVAGWTIAWRAMTPDRKEKWASTAVSVPDVEFSWSLLAALVGEVIHFVVATTPFSSIHADPLLALRLVAYVGVAVSTHLRAGRKLVWPSAFGMLATAASLAAIRVAVEYDATRPQRAMVACIAAAFAVALIAHSLPLIARVSTWSRRLITGAATAGRGRLILSTLPVALAIAGSAILVSIGMISTGVAPSVIQLTIVAVALVSLAIAELSEQSGEGRLRHLAVTFALVTIGLWASVDSGESMHPWLTGSMRWLVASVVTTATVLFIIPRLLGEKISARWLPALQRAAMVAAVTAGGSLAVMLAIEVAVRTSTGIDGISRPMVIGVAVTLAILSAICGLVALLSGSRKEATSRLAVTSLTDDRRRFLILAAQALGGITWLHVFLCKTQWAFFGLRSYWPYIVMALAFISVGVTEWARRRGDKVLSDTLRQTAMYLPLLPIVGFWLSPSFAELSWKFTGGKVRYDLLLALGAIYYIGLSAMWKQMLPKIGAVVLGNAALWVVLVQRPDWSFLVHPQAWLIPPAVCVLVFAQLYRERLQTATASAIRYAATLVIYVSSTADMLLQEIGTNISGPIVLVLLALAGMLAGVILRVRPFLYLGATFVFIGVTSMVWHAQRSIDAVWPWWVFGITTGVCLLAGLMALEKNKDKLRGYASTLATWQG